MLHILITVWLAFMYNFSGAQVGVRKSGPFKIEVEKLTKCDDEGTGEIVWGTKIYRKSDGNHTYSSSVYFGYPSDDDFKLSVEIQSWGNGGFRPRYFHHMFKGCDDSWKYFKNVFSYLKLDGVTNEKCPIPAGNYSCEDCGMNIFQVSNMPSMIYNKYKAIFIFFYKDNKVGCINIYGEAVPK